MVVKTITVTKNAYEALKSVKTGNESFSEAILRISRKKPLSNFYGILSKESGERLENAVMTMRKIRNKAHKKRISQIVTAMRAR